MKPVALVATLVLAGGCVLHTGQQPGDFLPAHTAMGVQASISLARTHLTGELLEARDTALVLLGDEQVALVPYSAIRYGTFSSTDVTVANGLPPSGEPFSQLRLLSRFPYGIPGAALRRLLASKRQESLVVIQQ
jgi:hypothetical protein